VTVRVVWTAAWRAARLGHPPFWWAKDIEREGRRWTVAYAQAQDALAAREALDPLHVAAGQREVSAAARRSDLLTRPRGQE
jgi:hypothetical protein